MCPQKHQIDSARWNKIDNFSLVVMAMFCCAWLFSASLAEVPKQTMDALKLYQITGVERILHKTKLPVNSIGYTKSALKVAE